MLITLEQMRAYLGLAEDDTDLNDFLTIQIGLVSDTIEAYCRTKFNSTQWTQIFYRADYPNQRTVQELFFFPAISVESVTPDDLPAIDPTLFRLNKPLAYLYNDSGWLFQKTMTVIYTAGYAAIPSPILNAIYTLVEERYNKKKSGITLNFGADVQRISIPGAISIDYDFTLNNNDRTNAFGLILGSQLNVLDFYRSDRAIIGDSKPFYVEETED